MEPLSASDVLRSVGGVPVGGLPARFTGISTDTRALAAGDLFVALRGENFDGHQFLAQAARAGATAALVDREQPVTAPLPLILVPDTTQALLGLARFQRDRLSARVVAITGSNGKTTTKDLTRAVCATRRRVVASPASFNNSVGVPLTLFLADRDTEVVVLEVGTNHPGEIAQLAAVIRPDVAIITNVAPAHLEGLGTLEGVREEKGALLDHVREGGCCVLNADDGSYEALRARARCRVVSVGVRKRADYVATMPFCDLDRIAFHVNGTAKVRVPLLGCHNLYNALMALAAAAELGIAVEVGAAGLKQFEGPPMRLTRHQNGERLVIDDAYNANPGSMKAAIKTFAALSLRGRKILVLGDMLELGGAAAELHRDVGRSLSCGTFDLIAAIGEHADALLSGARECGIDADRLVQYANADACARDLAARLRADDAVLVKGSRRMGLERVVKRLLDPVRDRSGAAC